MGAFIIARTIKIKYMKQKPKERIVEMWVVGEKRVGQVCFRKNKKMILYRDKPRKKQPWDLIEKVKVIIPIQHKTYE